MKKLKLSALNISASGLLTREQLRHVVGGSAGGHCQTSLDCGSGYYCYIDTCVASGGSGTCSSCPPGWRCLPNVNQCVL